jgi:hypothetical protein
MSASKNKPKLPVNGIRQVDMIPRWLTWWLFTAVILCGNAGCYSDSTKKSTQSEADGLALSIMAAQMNAAQTNWTVTVTLRTNK